MGAHRADSAELIQTTISIIPLIGFIHIVDTVNSDESITEIDAIWIITLKLVIFLSDELIQGSIKASSPNR